MAPLVGNCDAYHVGQPGDLGRELADKGALSMFDRTIAPARKTRPSSKEKVVVIDDSTREITELLLIQKNVTAVLGG